MNFADAHIHLTEKGCCYPDLNLAELLFSCTAKPDEWKTQMSIDDPRIIRFYGVHPWYSEQWNDDAEKELRDLLCKDPDAQVGEIGLDNLHPFDHQIEVFETQVSMASEFGRTVNVHNIGCDGEVAKILRTCGKGCRSIILHSFNKASISSFSGLDCYFSVNPRLLGKSEKNAKAVLSCIPEGRLLLETDAPFTSGKFTSMGDFISSISGMLGLSPETLSETVLENARRAIQ